MWLPLIEIIPRVQNHYVVFLRDGVYHRNEEEREKDANSGIDCEIDEVPAAVVACLDKRLEEHGKDHV